MHFNYNFTSGSINSLLTPIYKIKHFCKHSQDNKPKSFFFFNSTASLKFLWMWFCYACLLETLSYQHHI